MDIVIHVDWAFVRYCYSSMTGYMFVHSYLVGIWPKWTSVYQINIERSC